MSIELMAECNKCQKLIDIYGLDALDECNECGHLYRKDLNHCDCNHYECYNCRATGMTEYEIKRNDRWISEGFDPDIYKRLIDKVNLVDVHSIEGLTSIDGIPAICSSCLRKALGEIFMENNNASIIFIGSTKVEINNNGELIVRDTDDDIYLNGVNITEEFSRYKLLFGS
ncbi:MAG: hypothetical protein GF317_22795 [Candidatus Lokiarchaeota archaeon]|nr:hypothetical protein [Candidatus Lokiarchaeota archaeon]